MARPKKNNADYFSHDNSMRNHRKIKALRAEYGVEGFSAYVMLLETLTEADNFQLELRKELDWKILAGDFGIDSERLKDIFKLMEELELIKIKDCLVVCESLNERLEPVLEKREKSREQSLNKNRDEKGQYQVVSVAETRVSGAEMGVSVAETPQSKVNESKVNNYILAGEPAEVKKPLNRENEDSSIIGSVSMEDLYKKMDMKVSSRGVNQWQDEANNAFIFLGKDEIRKSSIFKWYRDNQDVARKALIECKDLEKPYSLYFLKVCSDIIKKQKENKLTQQLCLTEN